MRKGILFGGLGFAAILFLAGCASSKQSQEETVGQQAKTLSKEVKK